MKALLSATSSLLLLLMLSASAGAEGSPAAPSSDASPASTIKISRIGTDAVEVEPRRIVTSLFFITNTSSEAREVCHRVRLPEGWAVIAGDSTMELGAHQRNLSLVSILVPRMARPDQYSMTHTVRPLGYPNMVDSCSVAVTVLPVAKLEVRSLGAPDFVVAGADLPASFAISNMGNTAASVGLRTETAGNLPFGFENQALEIAPGKTRTVTLTLKTDPQLTKAIRDNLTLVAEATNPQASAHATVPIEVLPRITGIEDRFERIPSLLALRNVTSRNGVVRSRFQGEISGEGAFGEAASQRLAFLAKGPDVRRIGVLGRRDEYFLTYSSRHYEIAAGDRSYSVSQLADAHRYGRGLEAKVKLKQVRLGAYTLRNPEGEPRETQTAARLDYALSGTTALALNYLRKENGQASRASQAVGVGASITRAWNTDLDLEYSAGLGGSPDRNACYLKLRTARDRASGFLRFIRADAAYPGYFRDMEFIAAVVDLGLRSTSNLDASFRQERHNLAGMSLPVPTEREYQLRVDQRWGRSDMSLGWRARTHEDSQSDGSSDYLENVLRSSLGQRFTRWNYHTALESGWIHNEREGTSSLLERWSASLHVRPTGRQSYGFYTSYDTSRIPGKARKRSVTVGLTGSFRLRANTTIDLGFRTNNYEDGRTLESNMVDVTVSHRLPNRSSILLRGYYRPWESEAAHDEIAVSLEYAVPVGVPVAWRESVGTVRGRVCDRLTNLPVGDVILRLDGATAVTDPEGNFVFPSLPAGTYHIRPDVASIGLDRVTLEKVPIEVAVEGGKEISLQIAVTRSATLHGKVMLYRPKVAGTMGDAAKMDLVEDRGLPDVLVELADGVETKRVFTDEEGRFAFTEMRPGAWTLQVTEANLPEYTRLETSTFEFDPAPGDDIQVLAKVIPQQRQVQILHEGGVLKEEKPRK